MSEFDWYIFCLYTIVGIGAFWILCAFTDYFWDAYDEWRNEE